ncbi:MAG: hypothetical protein SLRJCFUN_002491 [Candidatus Fervidibacter sp.]
MAEKTVSELATEWERFAEAMRQAGYEREAQWLRHFPRTALDDELVRGLFIAATSVRDVRQAEKLVHRLLAIAPENPFAHLALSLVHLRAGRIPESAQAFDKALRLASTFPAHLSLKVHWLCLLGRHTQARPILRTLLRQFPERWETQRALAHFRMDLLSHSAWVMEALEKLAATHPDDAITRALLAKGFLRRGEREKADEHLRQMARHLLPFSFDDQSAFIAHALAKEVLAERFGWLRPFWWWERKFLRLPPRHSFILVGIFWTVVAICLALIHALSPSIGTKFFILAATLFCAYTRFADLLTLWWLRRKNKSP